MTVVLKMKSVTVNNPALPTIDAINVDASHALVGINLTVSLLVGAHTPAGWNEITKSTATAFTMPSSIDGYARDINAVRTAIHLVSTIPESGWAVRHPVLTDPAITDGVYMSGFSVQGEGVITFGGLSKVKKYRITCYATRYDAGEDPLKERLASFDANGVTVSYDATNNSTPIVLENVIADSYGQIAITMKGLPESTDYGYVYGFTFEEIV